MASSTMPAVLPDASSSSTMNTVYSLSLLSEYNHTLDSLPLDLSRHFADLRELDAVLSSSMASITAKITRLTQMIEDNVGQKDERLWLLSEIAEEASRLKPGGEDKIRVGCQAADALKGHFSHLKALSEHIPEFDAMTLNRHTTYPHVAAKSFMPPHLFESGRRRRTGFGSLLTSAADPSPAKRKRVVRDDDGDIKTPRKEKVIEGVSRARNGARAKKVDRAASPTESVLSVTSHITSQQAQNIASSSRGTSNHATSRAANGMNGVSGTNKRARNTGNRAMSPPQHDVYPNGALYDQPKTNHANSSTNSRRGEVFNVPPSSSHPSLPLPFNANGHPSTNGFSSNSISNDSTGSSKEWSGNRNQLEGPGMPVVRSQAMNGGNANGSNAATSSPAPNGAGPLTDAGTEGGDGDADGDGDDGAVYCMCGRGSFGVMIACDGAACPGEWFHISCIGLSSPPQGDWYCDSSREFSYSPYSKFRVGAALLAADGSIIKGANIENASYGGTICGERTAIVKAASEGKRSFAALAVVTLNRFTRLAQGRWWLWRCLPVCADPSYVHVHHEIAMTFGGSKFPGALGAMLIEVLPFLRGIASDIRSALGDGNPALVPTVFAGYALSSFLIGVVFILLGLLRLGKLVAYFPQTVLTGAIGAIGVSLFILGLGLNLPENSPDLSLSNTRSLLFNRQHLPLLAASFFPALFLSCSVRSKKINRWTQGAVQNAYYVPIYLSLIPVLFWVVVGPQHLDQDMLIREGWLFHVDSSIREEGGLGTAWIYWKQFDFGQVQWWAMRNAIENIVLLVVIGVLNLPIYVPTLAFSLDVSYDMDYELLGQGVANILAGAAGTMPNILQYSYSVFFTRANGGRFEAGLVTLLTFILFLTSGLLLPYVPTILASTLVLFLGIELTLEAMWESAKTLLPMEYAVVVGTLVACTFIGFAEGFGVGIGAAAAIYFVYGVADTRAREIKWERWTEMYAPHSGVPSLNTGTTPVVTTVDVENGVSLDVLPDFDSSDETVGVLVLSGYVFFASIPSIESRILKLKRTASFIVIDMTTVHRLETAAAQCFSRAVRDLGDATTLVICGLEKDSPVEADFQRAGVNLIYGDGPLEGKGIRVFLNRSEAVRWCQAQQISKPAASKTEDPSAIFSTFCDFFGFDAAKHPDEAESVQAPSPSRTNGFDRAGLQFCFYDAGETISHPSSECILFVVEGRVDAISRGEDLSASTNRHSGRNSLGQTLRLLPRDALRFARERFATPTLRRLAPGAIARVESETKLAAREKCVTAVIAEGQSSTALPSRPRAGQDRTPSPTSKVPSKFDMIILKNGDKISPDELPVPYLLTDAKNLEWLREKEEEIDAKAATGAKKSTNPKGKSKRGRKAVENNDGDSGEGASGASKTSKETSAKHARADDNDDKAGSSAPAKKAAKTSSSSKKSPEPIDLFSIYLDGDEEGTVEIYDSCDELRRKINKHLTKSGTTKAQFMRDIARAAYPFQDPPPKIQTKQLSDFLIKAGPTAGSTSRVFYAGYVYFEKKRLSEGKPKSEHREMMEDEWVDGIPRERPGQAYIIPVGYELYQTETGAMRTYSA
ncbi:hypothetical protein D9758_002435 [Tetrapyrgos nigripes]|uniref:STAS domain-containing protein n=1 Tax=Tetrapyrgos nigripes TaxID=182062 RepID=A0A8H5LSM1_9AGAR|nr:hypothetical protein D9758_002435 [Tetrapyrgos nigripes]